MDVKDEAFQGLVFPTRHFEGMDDTQIESRALEWIKTIPDLDKMAQHVLLSLKKSKELILPSSKVLSHSLIFLRQLLIFTAHPSVDRHVLSTFIDLENLNSLDLDSRQKLKEWEFSTEIKRDSKLIELLDLILTQPGMDPITVSIASQMLTELLCLGNTKILNSFSNSIKLEMLFVNF